MDITVTFPPGRAGALALVRMKGAGQKPQFRSLPITGTLDEEMDGILAFIWAHLDGPASMQGWLWEA
jgi:hypothetical protein